MSMNRESRAEKSSSSTRPNDPQARPEVGEWLQEYWEQSQIPGSGVHWGGLMQPLSYYQENLCKVYLTPGT